MEHRSKAASTLPREPGLNPLALRGATISGWAPSYRTCGEGLARQPYTTKLERMLATWLEYCPWVSWFHRGDMSSTFSKAYAVASPLGTPFRIPYELDGQMHDYWPDYVGKMRDGGVFIAEAGIYRHKITPEAIAKARAATHVATMLGGRYWIGTEDTLLETYFWNVASFQSDREPHSSFHEIQRKILPVLRGQDLVTVHDIVDRYGSAYTPEEVEATIRKLAGDAAALGCMVFDLSHEEFTTQSPFRLLDVEDPDLEPIAPAWLHESLEPLLAADAAEIAEDGASSPIVLTSLPGPVYDDAAIEDQQRRETFLNNLAAVTAAVSGEEKIGEIAKAHDMSRQYLHYLIRRATKHGQVACIPYWIYDENPKGDKKPRGLHPSLKEKIRELWGHPSQPTVMAVTEDDRLEDVCLELQLDEPSYDQVYRYVAKITHDPDIVRARAGLKHPPRPSSSATSYMLSIHGPGRAVQVDDHEADIFVTTKDGTVVPHKVHSLFMFCVATGAILAAVLCLGDPTEEDYMRLIKQAMEPKDEITRRAECENTWDCVCKPLLILHDNGKIFQSARAKEVLVDRLHIYCDYAPPYTPQVKGHIEALFTWISKKLFHRLAATTKSNPTKRGPKHDPAREAEKAGITLELLEKYLIQAIVDGYMRERDDVRGGRRYRLWQDAVTTYGVNRYLGSTDDLLLLLMKSQNRKNKQKGRYAVHHNKGVNFRGRWYVAPKILDPLAGKQIEIRYDRRDISVLYIFHNGVYQGAVPCPELEGRRYSIWEHEADATVNNVDKRAGARESLVARRHVLRQSRRGKTALRREAEKIERARQLDLQESGIHTVAGHAAKKLTAAAQATLNVLTQDDACEDSPPPTPITSVVEGLESVTDVDARPQRIIPIRRPPIIRRLPVDVEAR